MEESEQHDLPEDIPELPDVVLGAQGAMAMTPMSPVTGFSPEPSKAISLSDDEAEPALPDPELLKARRLDDAEPALPDPQGLPYQASTQAADVIASPGPYLGSDGVSTEAYRRRSSTGSGHSDTPILHRANAGNANGFRRLSVGGTLLPPPEMEPSSPGGLQDPFHLPELTDMTQGSAKFLTSSEFVLVRDNSSASRSSSEAGSTENGSRRSVKGMPSHPPIPPGMVGCPMTGMIGKVDSAGSNPMEQREAAATRSASFRRGPLERVGSSRPGTMRNIEKLSRLGSQRSTGHSSVAASAVRSLDQAPSASGRSMSRVSSTTSASQKRRKGGGGIVMDGIVSSRRAGRVTHKSKPPPFERAEMEKHSPIVETTWGQVMSEVGFFELAGHVCNTLEEQDVELRRLFNPSSEVAGSTFINLVSTLVSLASSLPELHDKLEHLAAMHVRKGVRVEHMPRMGGVIFHVLQLCLGEHYTEEVDDAWHWLWDWSSESMRIVLNSHGTRSSLVHLSWDSALDNYTEEELGTMLIDRLLEVAPNLQPMFSRPKTVMGLKLVEMFSTLVFLADDEEKLKEQMISLGAQHVKYGVKPQHAPVLEDVLIFTLQEAVAEEWNEEMEEAWRDLWQEASSLMMKTIEEGQKHGHVVEKLWKSVTQKGDFKSLGKHIVKYLNKAQPDIVGILTSGSLPTHEEDQLGGEQAVKHDGHQSKKKRNRLTVDNLVTVQSEELGVHVHFDQHKAIDSHRHWHLPHLSSFKQSSVFSHKSKQDAHTKVLKEEERTGSHESVEDTQAASARADQANELAWGEEMWGTLKIVFANLWEPQNMTEHLMCIASDLHKAGLQIDHLPNLGNALLYSMRVIMENPCNECGAHDWEDEISDAWNWLWQLICIWLHRTIVPMQKSFDVMVRDSWEAIKTSHSSEDIGDTVYRHLCTEAPYVIHLFTRPKNLQAYMFMQAIEMLVSFNENPEHFFHEMKPLTIRHIKYGVKSDYLKPFGRAIVGAVEEMYGEKWDDTIRGAWENLWNRVSSTLASSLNVGSNLITLSLITGDVDKLEEALELAPRGERIEWALRVNMHGNLMSPVYWAIRDGRISIAQFLIQDTLRIRADRLKYYYGRERLWETHPNLLTILCDECPQLVEDLQDGLMWQSQLVEHGHVRTNYYIQELYGDPAKQPDAWKSNLAILCLNGQPDMFMHPVLHFVLQVKFDSFGRNVFLAMMSWHAILLILFTVGFLEFAHECEGWPAVLRQITGALALVTLLGMTGLMVYQMLSGQTAKASFFDWLDLELPRVLKNPWNVTRYFAMLGLILSAIAKGALSGDVSSCIAQAERRKLGCGVSETLVMEFESKPLTWNRTVLCFTAIIMWGQLMQVLVINRHLAALFYSVSELFADVSRNLFVIAIILISIAAGVTCLQEPYFETFGEANMILMNLVLGLGATSMFDVMESWGLFIVVMFVIISEVGLLSILIAQLALSYETISVDKAGYARMNKAYVCVEAESLLPMSWRKHFYDQQGFHNPVEFDEGDCGPPGGIQVREPASVRAGPKYVPDRIIRAVGAASETDPWPSFKDSKKQQKLEQEVLEEEEDALSAEEELDRAKGHISDTMV